jgi:hypothetical protein
MVAYGITEDLQLSLSLPMPLHVPQGLPHGRTMAMMPSNPDAEFVPGWRFHRVGPAVGSRFDVVRRNGFSPKGADVRAVGRMVERGGKPALAVTGTEAVYTLAEDPARKGWLLELQKTAKDQAVVVEGSVPENAAESTGPLTLQVREFTLRTP